ncbi:hypothetical protein BDV37DRAFT_276718 [Aspergillus pseudonomiae]|uniref:Histidine phosphatase superfamily n=1 Tax=Aspergillus pseudonomiae TaxID=1506151 RepID=A0A5N7CVV2_9EURO|nr:uncharacterized protein BDV37DRAFT_276718 [Aspergillus pseudonomiae]KAE8397703.1 hypothetical protein BDV37DRAFT_276718 [Aspergillus pseudonomiae]
MALQVHLVRHAESVHNQAQQLIQSFPDAPKVGAINTSPLKRAIQTTLAGFSHILDKRYFDTKSGQGIENGATLILDPNLQERSALPCDTGSGSEDLDQAFPKLVKEGFYSPADEAVKERAKRATSRSSAVSEGLKNQKRTHIVVVTYGVFMKFLSRDSEIDLLKAGW